MQRAPSAASLPSATAHFAQEYGMATIEITLPDQLALLARSTGQLTSENIEMLLRVQLQSGAALAEPLQAEKADGILPEQLALKRLIRIARADTGQSRRVADFLLAWWNAGSCGSFDLTNLWGVDTAIADDMVAVFRYIAATNKYPDALGFKEEFAEIVRTWRPELE